MMWDYGFSWGGMFLMMLGTTLWIVLLAVLVWALVRWLSRSATTETRPYSGAAPVALSAEEILRQRYARGEIDRATFEQMLEQLGASSTPGARYKQPTMSGR